MVLYGALKCFQFYMPLYIIAFQGLAAKAEDDDEDGLLAFDEGRQNNYIAYVIKYNWEVKLNKSY